jgi:hypothetical protein
VPASAVVVVLSTPGAAVPVGGSDLGSFVSEHAVNDFPRLPVREGEDLVVSLRWFPSVAAAREFASTLADVQHLVLLPTSRSQVR